MKMNLTHRLFSGTLALAAGFAVIYAATTREAAAQSPGNFTVHEWGTFTSVQGGNGALLSWQPLKSSELPAFVHDWFKPGLNVVPQFMTPGGKGGMVTLQRMETPVIYFYSAAAMQAEVSVGFPKGIITEWYPRPTQIGPAEFTSKTDPAASLHESRVSWRHLTLTPPAKAGTELSAQLPVDQAGRNYFAARETDSDYVQTALSLPLIGTSETEKFLFYRGAGSFQTPLHVVVDGPDHFALGNTGTDQLAHLFVLHVQDGYGAFTSLDALSPGQTNGVADNNSQRLPLVQFQDAIATQMVAALVDAGLFDREARAMVNTWRDSWFTETGTRVLYILPRPWTDETLPMTLNPKPDQLVRVMVGRAEVITPEVQTHLLEVLTRAKNGDLEARTQAGNTIKGLGRFALPALTLAANNNYTNGIAELGYQLLIHVSKPQN